MDVTRRLNVHPNVPSSRCVLPLRKRLNSQVTRKRYVDGVAIQLPVETEVNKPTPHQQRNGCLQDFSVSGILSHSPVLSCTKTFTCLKDFFLKLSQANFAKVEPKVPITMLPEFSFSRVVRPRPSNPVHFWCYFPCWLM